MIQSHLHLPNRDQLQSKCMSVLNDLDDIVLKKWEKESHGLLSGSGGAALYLYFRFKQSRNENYTSLALEILNKEIQDIND